MPEAVTQSARFSLFLWNSGSAPFTRVQMQHNQTQLEALAAKFRAGDSGNMGAAGTADNLRSFYYNTTDNRLYFSNGSSWVAISGLVLPSDFDTTVAGSGLSLNTSTGLAVNVDNSTLEVSSDNLRVRTNGITETQLNTTAGSEAVITAAIRTDAVTQDKIADNAVRKEHIKDGEVVAGKLGTNAVVLDNMQNNSVDTNQIVNLAVTGAKMADAPNGVSTLKINDGAVTGAKVASAPNGITTTKINDQAVETGNIKDLAVTTDKVNDLAVTTGKINDLAVTTDKINDLAVATGKINDLAVATGKIDDLAVTPQKIAGVSGIDKGAIVGASGPNTLTTLPVGGNGQYLVVDPTQNSGLRWATLGVTQSQMTFDTPTAYTPTWGGPAGINLGTAGAGGQDKTACTLEGYYLTVGSLVWVHVRLLIGDATDISKGSSDTPWTFLLPVLPVATRPQIIPGYIHNADLTDRKPVTGLIRPNVGNGDVIGQIATPSGAAVFRSSPYSWTAGAQLVLEGWYQKA